MTAIKTSEFLRNAVDEFLWDGSNLDYTVQKKEFICWALQTYANNQGDVDAWETHQRLNAEIEKDISVMDTRSSVITNAYDKFVRDTEGQRINSIPEAQILRFMYAEFLALYFETDLGD